jgi:formylglycine-generating enzyme required for sulfatase activity
MRESGWIVRLPTEEEWESAARHFEDGENSPLSGPSNLMGGLWEWCANPFSPLNIFSTIALERIDSAGAIPLERSVRGGSWINTPGSVDVGIRGSLPPETSSPFVGFRPFMVYESDEEWMGVP